MTKSFYILLPLFLSLFLFITPTFAYFSLDVNTTLSMDLPLSIRGMACTNATGTLYCYTVAQCNGGSPNSCVYRFNATWGDAKECQWNSLNYIASNLYIANATHIGLVDDAPQLDNFLIDVSNISLDTNCSDWTLIESNYNVSNAYYQAGNYFPSNFNSSEIYWAENDIIINGTTGKDIRAGWGLTELKSVHFPNESDNNTAYSTSVQTGDGNFADSFIYKTTNGLGYAVYDNPFDIYGIPEQVTPAQAYFVDFHKVDNSTTYIFMAYNGRVYRANWSEYETAYRTPTITAIAPVNNASALQNPAQLQVSIETTIDGTIEWTIDGSIVGSTAITNSTSAQTIYFTSPVAQSTGYHNWSANFTDSASRSWLSGTQWFLTGTANFFEDPAEALAQMFGSFFSVEDLDTSKNIFGLLISVIVATLSVVGIASVIHKFDGATAGIVFFAVFFAMIIMFWNAGFLDAWIPFSIFVLVILLVVFAFSKGR